MLLANIIAGETMVKNCEEIALLRKHEIPQEKKIKALKTLMFIHILQVLFVDTPMFWFIVYYLIYLNSEKKLENVLIKNI